MFAEIIRLVAFSTVVALPAFCPAIAAGAPASADSADAPPFVVVAGDTLWLAPSLEVLGSRVPAALPGVQRQVQVLTETELGRLPGRSVPEQLQNLPTVVTGQRQQFGVQSDLSIRGSTFEQVQVLLDGYDLSDPQTGHHLMNLPVAPQDIARVEVLPGHGSALYGSGAFGGTINVVTRRPGERPAGELAFTGGGDGVWGARGNLDLVGRPDGRGPRARFSLARFHADGQVIATGAGAATTEADVVTATHRLTSKGDGGEFDLLAGFARRSFGAPGFYAPYPSWERTQTFFAAVRANRRVSERFTVEPRLFGRRHEDRFVLLRDDPEVFTNNHATRKLGGELRGILALGGQRALAVGVEGVYEDIVSIGVRSGSVMFALGEHQRRRASLSAELDQNGGPWRWQLGGRLDLRSDWRSRAAGTVAVSRDVGDGLALNASAGTVYRVPTFTDLYYESPSSRGDPDLQPEHGWAWDVGLTAERGAWIGRVAFFERHERDLIDWARTSGATVWQVMNIANATVKGVETEGSWRHPRGHQATLGVSWLDRTVSLAADHEGRYALLIPRWVLVGSVTAVLPGRLEATLAGRYLERTGGDGGFRVAAAVDGRLDWRQAQGLFLSLVGTNLLDRSYEEVPGVPMPGTLLTATVGRQF